ncbi:hypothetical protein KM043_006559 [Ampulex compressa]|nr:hypothetical protein KM043_006559 [Ampulex compressa]
MKKRYHNHPQLYARILSSSLKRIPRTPSAEETTQLWEPFVSTLLKVVSRVTRNVAGGCLRVFKDGAGRKRERRESGGRAGLEEEEEEEEERERGKGRELEGEKEGKGEERERKAKITGCVGEWAEGGGDSASSGPCGRTVLITTRPPIFFGLKGAEVFARGNGD